MKRIVHGAVVAALAVCIGLPCGSSAGQAATESQPRPDDPTLEETIAFIKKNLDEDIGGGNRLVTEFKEKCTATSSIYGTGTNDPSEKRHLILFELYSVVLKDVNNIELSHNSFNDKMYFHLKADNSVKHWITSYQKGNFYTRYTEGASSLDTDNDIPLCVKAEHAERTKKALEHAVRLCGGSVQKDPF